MTYRTLNEIQALAPRTRQQAGRHGPIDDPHEPQTWPALIGWGAVGSVIVYLFVMVVLGWA